MIRSGKSDYYVTLDIGGTSVKSAVLTKNYEVLTNSFSIIPTDSNGPSKQIIDAIIAVIAEKFSLAKTLGEVRAIGISFPEFSDYKQGTIAIMKDKFQNSGGISLRGEIIKGLGLSNNFHIVFEEDSIAFLRGAVKQGKVKNFGRIIGLTLGTGLGSAFMIREKIIRNASDVPPEGELGCLPYKGGIIEDMVSNKGIINIYERSTGKVEKDVKSISIYARKGDTDAIRTFEEFGRTMGQIIRPYADDFKVECIIIGGQIAKSFDLFEVSLRKELFSIPSLKEIVPAQSIDFSPFYGLLKMIKSNL